jgi:pimeloyl-ACP methyl ester carboxylesterase
MSIKIIKKSRIIEKFCMPRLLRPVLAIGLSILVFPYVLQAQPHYIRQYLTIAGKKMSYTSFGLDARRPGQPVVVFEAGFGATGSFDFTNLYAGLSKFCAGIGYDRNGEGASDEDSTIMTDADLVHRLHLFLETAHVPPPYLLVGHSMGVAYIRLFTALYPKEVAGLLMIDGPDFMLTDQQDEQIKVLSKSGQGSKAWIVPYQDSLANDTMLSVHVRHRVRRLANLFREKGVFWEYHSLPPLPDIPVGVLAAYDKQVVLSRGDSGVLTREPIAQRFYMENYATMIKANHHSFFMLLPGYSHAIHHQDPELVIWAIDRLFQAARGRRA